EAGYATSLCSEIKKRSYPIAESH
ncbi:hypothetical protein, partial [Listeria monocytogenes]